MLMHCHHHWSEKVTSIYSMVYKEILSIFSNSSAKSVLKSNQTKIGENPSILLTKNYIRFFVKTTRR